MRVTYVGAGGVRVVGDLVWQGAGTVLEVAEAETVVKLLLQPGDQFVIAWDEPLLQLEGVDEHVAGSMALEGIGGLADLAELTARPAGQLAKALGLDREVVKAWVAEAKKLVEV